MKLNISQFKIKGLTFLFLMLFAVLAYAQDGKRIRGTVRNIEGMPIEGVAVINTQTGITIGVTDEYGSYSAVIEPDGSLKFSCVGYKNELVAVKGEMVIDVVLSQDIIEIDEVVVQVLSKKKVIPEPTDIEIKGNYFHLKTRFSVPKWLFKNNTRLIAQPSIYNVTTGERRFMDPLVFDAPQYNITQERMYDYDMSKDPLAEFVQVKETAARKSDLITYHDSLYIQKPDDDYRADVYLSMENYNKIIYADTFSIARGTINPLRFLEYDFNGMRLTDSIYMPKAEMQLMDTEGEVNLTFLIGKDEIDPSDPNNDVELQKLERELKAIEMSSDASMQSLYVEGLSSPDGRFQSNLNLAKKRTNTAFNRILAMLSPSTRNVIEKGTSAKVQDWEVVVDLLMNDSLTEEAGQVQQILDKYENMDSRSMAIARLPFYRTLLAKDYLPKLRKVEYRYEYSIFRFLTDDEIKALYAEDYKKLTANEFYRLINLAENDDEREKYCRQALERYPKLLFAANELAVVCLRKGKADASILEKFINTESPQPVIYNQVLSLLKERRLVEAYDLLGLLKNDDRSDYLKAVVEALNGDYEMSFGPIASYSDFNEVLMLLAMKNNDDAWAKAKRLNSGTAKEFYIKAVAANRTENVVEAMAYMEQAFALDPSLKEVAKIDGDLLDLLPEGQIRE